MNELWLDSSDGFNPESTPDYLELNRLHDLQNQRLRVIVKWTYDNVSLFRKRMEDQDLKPGNIETVGDISCLPFTQKTDLRDTYPYGLFATDVNEIVRLHASSGTTGKPIVVAYTDEDVDLWASVMKRTFASCGLHRGDIIQNAYGYGLFTGGLGAHYGAENLGATVIPISGGNTDRQLMVMQDFNVTALCATPSYFLHIMDRAHELGISLRDLPLKAGIFGAEPWTDAMREHIEEETGIKAYDIYGLSELIGPGVGSECECQNGLHIFEDHFYPEIVDPDTGVPLPEGETGELVLTSLTKRAMPMIRYRTHDVTRIIDKPCECGRSIRRIERISHRTDDMLIVRGVNVFPSQVESALLKVEGTLPHYQIILTRDEGLDQMEVRVEVTEEVFSDRVRAMEDLEQKLTHALENTLSIRVSVRLVEPQTIERSTGKARRVIDKR